MSPTSRPSAFRRRVVLLGSTIAVTLFLAVGVAVGAVPGLDDEAALPVSAAVDFTTAPDATPAPEPPAVDQVAVDPAAAAAGPADTPAAEAPEPEPESAPVATPAPTAPTTAAAAPVPTPPPTTAPAKLPPGQRVNPTSAEVQVAITQLHQRIPLFQPTDPQLRTFAEAACASFDQGQTWAQVQATVRDAVSRVQGASLSAADAEFAVATVVRLRCPGYLP
ncbi:MAG TPA: hypothetical protein VM942_10865 [Acidimicrobiales bacterium]|nr:hypothetical protein [Acidimicrobiales bacterium]